MSQIIFKLSDARLLAYSKCGQLEGYSSIIVCFHGALGIGDFSSFDLIFKKFGYLCIAPTLPGWGQSTESPGDVWVDDYYKDMTELLKGLGLPKGSKLELMGVSYGSLAVLHLVWKLQEYQVSKAMICSGFMPFRWPGLDYSQGMTFQTRLTMGSFAKTFPGFSKFTVGILKKSGFKTIESTIKFADDNLMKSLNADEVKQRESIRMRNPDDSRLKIEVIGQNMYKSMEYSTKGYTTIPQNLWDVNLWNLPSSLNQIVVPCFVFGATDDVFAPVNLQRTLTKSLNPQLVKYVEKPGGHSTWSFLFQDLFQEYVEWNV